MYLSLDVDKTGDYSQQLVSELDESIDAALATRVNESDGDCINQQQQQLNRQHSSHTSAGTVTLVQYNRTRPYQHR